MRYEVSCTVDGAKTSYAAYGDELMSVGIPIKRDIGIPIGNERRSALGGDFASIVFEILAE